MGYRAYANFDESICTCFLYAFGCQNRKTLELRKPRPHDERDKAIFLRVMAGASCVFVGVEYGISGARVGQIVHKVARMIRLWRPKLLPCVQSQPLASWRGSWAGPHNHWELL